MSRFSGHDLDDIRARNPIADVAGGYVKLRRAGGRLVGPCPICGGRGTSQRFEILEKGESWVCAVCPDGGDVIRLVEKVEGCDFLRAVERLGGRATIDADQCKRLFEEREAKRLAREKDASRYRENERKRLWRAWTSAASPAGTPVEEYLHGRGLLLPPSCPGIRYQPSAIYWHGEITDSRGRKSPQALHTGPAMVAAFIRPDGHFGGTHTTWLNADRPPAKLELDDPATGEVLNSKKMRGSKTGAHIAIADRVDDPERLVIGEGIETVLAVWTAHVQAGRDLTKTAFWASGDLGNMAGRAIGTIAHPELTRPDGRAQRVPGPMPDPDDKGLSIPDTVTELILLGDGDSETVLTQFAMERAARRYAKDGRTIRVVFAPAGMDFNDVLQVST